MMEGMSNLSSKSGNLLHGPFDLAAIPPANTHNVDATTCTYGSSRTPPGKRSIVLEVKENTTTPEVCIMQANGHDLPDDEGANVIPGDNFAHSLFSSIILELNGMEVSHTSSYAEHAYLDVLLDSTQIEKETTLFAEEWKGDGCHSKNIGDYTANQILSRRAYTNNSPTLYSEFKPKIPV